MLFKYHNFFWLKKKNTEINFVIKTITSKLKSNLIVYKLDFTQFKKMFLIYR